MSRLLTDPTMRSKAHSASYNWLNGHQWRGPRGRDCTSPSRSGFFGRRLMLSSPQASGSWQLTTRQRECATHYTMAKLALNISTATERISTRPPQSRCRCCTSQSRSAAMLAFVTMLSKVRIVSTIQQHSSTSSSSQPHRNSGHRTLTGKVSRLATMARMRPRIRAMALTSICGRGRWRWATRWRWT